MKPWILLLILLSLFVVSIHADIPSDGKTNTSMDWNQKAFLLQKSGNYTEALDAVNLAIDLNPDNKYALGTKASILIHLKQYEEALTILNRATDLAPEDQVLWGMLADLKSEMGVGNQTSDIDLVKKANELQHTKKPQEALKVINQVLEKDQSNAEAWRTKGSILVKLGDRERAINAINQSVQLNPDDAKAWHLMALTYEKMNKYEEAIKAYDQEIRLNPTSEIINNKAYNLQVLGRYQEALTVVNQALELNPDDPYAQGTRNSILSHL